MSRLRIIAELEEALSELRCSQLITDKERRLFRLCDAALFAILSDLEARLARIETGRS